MKRNVQTGQCTFIYAERIERYLWLSFALAHELAYKLCEQAANEIFCETFGSVVWDWDNGIAFAEDSYTPEEVTEMIKGNIKTRLMKIIEEEKENAKNH